MNRWLLPLAAAAGAVLATAASAPLLAQPAAHRASARPSASASASAPAPIADGAPTDWFFAFKMNAKIFPSGGSDKRDCPFGGSPVAYSSGGFSQQYAYATKTHPALHAGTGLIGTGVDPLGATFGQVWNGRYYYVVWNDQFYRHPAISGCTDSCGAPWGHSKGILAWNEAGEGMVLQVTTPSWPGAASAANPRVGDGNTLGCVTDNDVKVSQHFFALRLSEKDVEQVLAALANASVVSNTQDPSLVRSGGPAPIVAAVARLGHKSASTSVLDTTLSSGVRLISKPSALHVPPWQLVSARLNGVPLRTATWWTAPAIPATDSSTKIACWDATLGRPGPVAIATTGTWNGKAIGLQGGPSADRNHGKIGVSTAGDHPYAIFGDMNQQGALGPAAKCGSSQNGRGGLFFVVEDRALHDSVAALITGDSAAVAK